MFIIGCRLGQKNEDSARLMAPAFALAFLDFAAPFVGLKSVFLLLRPAGFVLLTRLQLQAQRFLGFRADSLLDHLGLDAPLLTFWIDVLGRCCSRGNGCESRSSRAA